MTEELEGGLLIYGQPLMRVAFVRLPVSVACDLTLSDGAHRLYCIIASFIWDGRTSAWPSQQTLADKMGVTTRTIRTHQRALEEHGLLSVEHRKGRSSIYRLIIPEPRTDPSALPRKNPSYEVEGEEVDEGTTTTLALSEPPVPPSPARRTKQRMTDKQASMQETLLLGDLPDRDANLMLEVVECLSKGAATPRSRLNRLNEMLDLLAEVGHEAWEYGMRKAADKGTIRGVAYVRAVAKGYLEDPKESPKPRQLISDDGPTSIDRKLAQEEAERAEALRREREGQA